MKIRTYQDTDKNDVIALWRDCGLVSPQNNPVKDIERKLKVDPGLFLVGICNNKVIATVMGGYEGHRGWINYLGVSPAKQRKRYGEQIMKAVEVLIKEKGCPKINLQVRTTNKSVISFYEALGYDIENVVGFGKRLDHNQ